MSDDYYAGATGEWYPWGSVHYKDEYDHPCSKEYAERYGSTEMSINKRVGTATRNRYVEHLSNMVAEGYIDDAEFDERSTKALATKFEDELRLLVADLEPVPYQEKPKAKHLSELNYHACAGFEDLRFRPWRWAVCITLFSSLTILSGPLLAALCHGFDNAPWDGVVPIFMILIGVIGLLVTGIGFAPGEHKSLTRLNSKHQEKYRRFAE